MGRRYYPTIERQTDEKKEKERKYQQEISNRKAQGFICGNCKFFKENAVLHDERKEGRCLKSINGVKNPSTIFDSCGGPRTVYASEIHRCFA